MYFGMMNYVMMISTGYWWWIMAVYDITHTGCLKTEIPKQTNEIIYCAIHTFNQFSRVAIFIIKHSVLF
jgi:hypothetical protein